MACMDVCSINRFCTILLEKVEGKETIRCKRRKTKQRSEWGKGKGGDEVLVNWRIASHFPRMTWNSTTRVLVSSKQESLTTRDFLWRTTPSTLLLLLLLIRRSLCLFQTLDSRQTVVHSGRPFVRPRSSSEFFFVFVFSFNCNNRQQHDLRENQNTKSWKWVE